MSTILLFSSLWIKETFRYYLCQDHQYLRNFQHLHELVAKHLPADDAKLLLSLGAGEDQARQALHQALQITLAELDQTSPAPTNYAYITHMYYQLTKFGVAVATAGLLPCYWLYNEVGKGLAQKQSPDPLYQAFFDSYGGEDFTTSTTQMREIVDRLALQVDQPTQTLMRGAFAKSCYYEVHFWQMALTKENW